MSDTLTAAPTPSGSVIVAGRSYLVFALTELGGWTGENGRSRALCILESPRGAQYLITDNGAKYRPMAWNLGNKVSQRSTANRFIMSTPFTRHPLRRDDLIAALGAAR